MYQFAENKLRGWIAHLRSGEYQQGIGYLRDASSKYCCLGVYLAAVAGLASERLTYAALPDDMENDWIIYMDGPLINTLIVLNDDFRLDFDGIALFLEERIDKIVNEQVTTDWDKEMVDFLKKHYPDLHQFP